MTQWFHAEGNRQQGPLTSEELVALYTSSRIGLDTLVWRDGLAVWEPLRSVADELGLVLDAPPAAAAAPEPTPPPVPPRLPATFEIDTAPRAAAAPPQAAPVRTHAAPPPKSRSGCLVVGLVLGVVGLVLVAVAGILAAIALPAYQDYTARAKVSQAMSELEPLKLQVAEFVDDHDRCPVNGDDGFRAAESYAGQHLGTVRIGRFGDALCGIEAQLDVPQARKVDGTLLWLEYDIQRRDWTCSGEADDKYLPTHCRG